MILPAKPYAPHLSGNELGLRENWRQFSLLVVVNAFGMVGLERTVVPLTGSEEFKIGPRYLCANSSITRYQRAASSTLTDVSCSSLRSEAFSRIRE
jgi:hypothetical protein